MRIDDDECTGITPTKRIMVEQVSLILKDKNLKRELIIKGYLKQQSKRQTKHTMRLKRLMAHWCYLNRRNCNGQYPLMPIETVKIAVMDLD
jgi:hypothetical protein